MKVTRLDLTRCYNYYEYNKAIEYGKTNAMVSGVTGCMENLQMIKNNYNKEMENLVTGEKEKEQVKYSKWNGSHKTKWISLFIWIGCPVLKFFIENSSVLSMISTLAGVVLLVAFLTEWISGKIYTSYAKKIDLKIIDINERFAYEARNIYQKIDNLYLNTLEPAHREAVLMRREQQEHHRKMEEEAKKQTMLEQRNLEATERAREASEELLKIEREREAGRRW